MLQSKKVNEMILDEKTKNDITEFLTNKRKKIMYILADKVKLTQGELAKDANTSVASLSNILVRFDLFEYKLIDSIPEGKFRYYFLTDLGKTYIDILNKEDGYHENAKVIQHQMIQLVQQVKGALKEFIEIHEDDWEIELEDALINRIQCQEITCNKSEQLVDDFIISIEKLLLYNYDEYITFGLKLLSENNILQTRLSRFLEKYEGFRSILEQWNREEELVQIYDMLERAVKTIRKRQEINNGYGHYYQKKDEEDNMISVMDYILNHIRIHDKQEINNCFMRYMAGNKALSAYMTQIVWNYYNDENSKLD